ncbi:Hypothetical predicted protein [Octopus vulgaris]|uniref:Uncharacterized protein n=2 Tax=Octopus TaxID=6643 RepID=A0AA36AQM6_OCTVU|nr:uncharacterized protein LOC115209282 [Octopus sinensis]XP_036357486.1 uncharacterized protein LOC115209282 [Octopus sinensis]CAI9720526.1 Hypothetical predicted protein [Octopus vulgaris]
MKFPLSDSLHAKKGSFLLDPMKTKNFYLVILFAASTIVAIWLLSNPTPNFQTIVKETNKHINSIKNLPSSIKHAKELDDVDPEYLELLGFRDGSSSRREDDERFPSKENVNLPVIASGVEPGQYKQVIDLLESVHRYLPHSLLILYDLDIDSSENVMLKKHCNNTKSCILTPFDFKRYPSHLKDLSTKSYRPLCIQEILNRYGGVIWADSSEHFITNKMNQSVTQAQTIGLVAWTIKEPTSSLTHPKMFQYFKTKPENYYFHRAVESSHLIVFNLDRIHHELMLPWVRCALTQECISPTGAQNVGCNYQRKPLFRYSGCHRYDMSALNVILGLLFNFNTKHYTARQQVFGVLNKERISGKNLTAPLYISKLRYL